MTQYAKLRVKMPKGYTISDLKKDLRAKGVVVESTGVFNNLDSIGMVPPDDFVPKEADE